jgi:hypothetical protein
LEVMIMSTAQRTILHLMEIGIGPLGINS